MCEHSGNDGADVQKESSAAEIKEGSCNCGCSGKTTSACRKAVNALLWVIGLIAVIFAILLLFRDMYIPSLVSKAGTFVLGTKVELKKFSSSLSGKVDIQGLSIANPEGYTNAKAFVLDHVYVNVSMASLFTDDIVVKEILVTGMQVDLEAKLNKTNLGELQDNVKRLVPVQTAEVSGNQNVSDESEDAAQKSVVIEKLNINNNSISFSNSMFHMTTRVPLVPINMENVGQGQTAAETFNEIFLKILTSVFDACTSVGGALGDSVKGAGAALTDSAAAIGKGVGTGLSDAAKGLGKGLSDSTEKLLKGIK